MRGAPLSPKYGPTDLSLIFFKLRTTRDRATRRSLQRRARLALNQVPTLTPAERHEVCAVWSRRDMGNIDSPAMRKLLKQDGPHDWQTVPVKRYTRMAMKKPGKPRLDAANDPLFSLQLCLIFGT